MGKLTVKEDGPSDVVKTEWADMSDYSVEYLNGIHVVTIRTKDDGNVALMGQNDWSKRRILEVVAEIPIYDIRSVHHTGIPLVVVLKDGKHMVIADLEAVDMWHEYREAQFDEYKYMDTLDSAWDDVKERIEDGLRERLDDDRIDPGTLKAWTDKWKQMLSDMEEALGQDDGVHEDEAE